MKRNTVKGGKPMKTEYGIIDLVANIAVMATLALVIIIF